MAKRFAQVTIVAAVLFAVHLHMQAETVKLKNGEVLEGKVVAMTETKIILEVKGGEHKTIPLEDVQEIDKKETASSSEERQKDPAAKKEAGKPSRDTGGEKASKGAGAPQESPPAEKPAKRYTAASLGLIPGRPLPENCEVIGGWCFTIGRVLLPTDVVVKGLRCPDQGVKVEGTKHLDATTRKRIALETDIPLLRLKMTETLLDYGGKWKTTFTWESQPVKITPLH